MSRAPNPGVWGYAIVFKRCRRFSGGVLARLGGLRDALIMIGWLKQSTPNRSAFIALITLTLTRANPVKSGKNRQNLRIENRAIPANPTKNPPPNPSLESALSSSCVRQHRHSPKNAN